MAVAGLLAVTLGAVAAGPAHADIANPQPATVTGTGVWGLGTAAWIDGLEGCDPRGVDISARAFITELGNGQMFLDKVEFTFDGDRPGSSGIIRVQDGAGAFTEFQPPGGFFNAEPFGVGRKVTTYAVGQAFPYAGTGRVFVSIGVTTERYDEVIGCALNENSFVPFQMNVPV